MAGIVLRVGIQLRPIPALLEFARWSLERGNKQMDT